MITKSVKKLLLAALAISLFAGSALADVQDPTPIEDDTGTVTIGVSFDAATDSIAVTKEASTKAYSPEFRKLKAFKDGISKTAGNIKTAATTLSTVATTDSKATDIAILTFITDLTDAANSASDNDTKKTLSGIALKILYDMGYAVEYDSDNPTPAYAQSALNKFWEAARSGITYTGDDAEVIAAIKVSANKEVTAAQFKKAAAALAGLSGKQIRAAVKALGGSTDTSDTATDSSSSSSSSTATITIAGGGEAAGDATYALAGSDVTKGIKVTLAAGKKVSTVIKNDVLTEAFEKVAAVKAAAAGATDEVEEAIEGADEAINEAARITEFSAVDDELTAAAAAEGAVADALYTMANAVTAFGTTKITEAAKAAQDAADSFSSASSLASISDAVKAARAANARYKKIFYDVAGVTYTITKDSNETSEVTTAEALGGGTGATDTVGTYVITVTYEGETFQVTLVVEGDAATTLVMKRNETDDSTSTPGAEANTVTVALDGTGASAATTLTAVIKGMSEVKYSKNSGTTVGTGDDAGQVAVPTELTAGSIVTVGTEPEILTVTIGGGNGEEEATDTDAGSTALAGFYTEANNDFAAFRAMFPDIAKLLNANPTASTVDIAKKVAEYSPAAYAAKAYVETFARSDDLAKGSFKLDWKVSDEAGYDIEETTVRVLLLKDATVTVPLKVAAATMVPATGTTKTITADTKVVHVEIASFDKDGKAVYGPEDVTDGLKLDKAFVEAHKDLLVRVMFTSKGDQATIVNSVGILKEAVNATEAGTLPKGTLAEDPVATLASGNAELFAALAAAYPYFVEFPLTLAVSGDTAAAGSETYTIKASDVVLTGSDGQSKTVATSTKYAVSQDTAAKDALWTAAPVVFSVSSDQLASFEITVSADANVISAKASDGGDATITGKKIDFDGIEGTYTIILSSDLVASSDATKVSTDAGYFAITVDVLSVSVAPVVPGKTDSESEKPEASGDVDSGDTPVVPVGPVAVDPADAETTTSNGETVAAAGQAINNAFTGSNGASAISSLINSATAAEMADAADVAGALGLDEDDIGDATKGYKAIGFEIPESQTMPAEGTPFFVITRNGSTNHVGFGYVPKRRAGYERILAVLFKLFRDTADTTDYMTVDAGDNTVAATDSAGETSGDVSTVNRVVFVTADGDAFSVKTDGTVPLQGQSAAGTASEIVKGDDDDDDDNATSGHGGGSSGCDAGFGLIALAAVALAARKIRK